MHAPPVMAAQRATTDLALPAGVCGAGPGRAFVQETVGDAGAYCWHVQRILAWAPGRADWGSAPLVEQGWGWGGIMSNVGEGKVSLATGSVGGGGLSLTHVHATNLSLLDYGQQGPYATLRGHARRAQPPFFLLPAATPQIYITRSFCIYGRE